MQQERICQAYRDSGNTAAEAAKADEAAKSADDGKAQELIGKAKNLIAEGQFSDAGTVLQQLAAQSLSGEQQILVDGLKEQLQKAPEETMSMIKEFKEFAMKGSVVDLAAGVIIGVAFGKVVTSVVNDVIMPPIGKMMGGVNFADLFLNLDPSKLAKDGSAITSLAQAKEAGAAVIAYGSFINTVIDFAIVTFCVFMIIKAMNSLKKPAAPAMAPEPTKEVKLLTEIRDVLQARPESTRTGR